MTNKDLLDRLYKIGKLPTTDIVDKTNFPLLEFDEILQQFANPLTIEEAVKLVNLSSPINESCYEIEWGIVHLVETIDTNLLQEVLNKSEDGEVKQILQIRLNNYYQKNSI
jgi:hypothetical protein